jgi:hypothetical protein
MCFFQSHSQDIKLTGVPCALVGVKEEHQAASMEAKAQGTIHKDLVHYESFVVRIPLQSQERKALTLETTIFISELAMAARAAAVHCRQLGRLGSNYPALYYH